MMVIVKRTTKILKIFTIVHFLQKQMDEIVQFYICLIIYSYFGHNSVVQYNRREKDPNLTRI